MSAVFRRSELESASLDLGSVQIDLADYATTGLRVIAIGPSGIGKTNAGMLVGEQLAAQGWVNVIFDPEGESQALYGKAVRSPEALYTSLEKRDKPFNVVNAKNATEFLPFAEVVMQAAEDFRKPIFAMVDEGQIFSAARKRKGDIGAASDMLNDFVERGRKRSLDVFFTAHRFAGSLHRSIFTNKNLTLIGAQEDPTAWSALAPQFRGSHISFHDLRSLAPGEFFCFSRRGIEKTVMPMATALAAVAPKAKRANAAPPSSFSQWDRAMRQIPTVRLQALDEGIVALLGAIAGLTSQQLASGAAALQDELATR